MIERGSAEAGRGAQEAGDRTAILALLGAALAESAVLRDRTRCKLLLNLLSARLGVALSQPAGCSSLSLVHEIVKICARLPTGLSALVDTLADVEGESTPVRRARQLQSEWDAHDLYEAADLAELRTILRGLTVQNLAGFYLAAIDFRSQSLPSHCDGVWPTFAHLAGLNADRNGVPPSMIFLERIADRSARDLANRLRAWNDRIAATMHLGPELSAARADAVAVDNTPTTTYLVMQLQPDGLDPTVYHLSHWWQPGSGGLPVQRGEVSMVTRDQIEARVGELVRRAELSLPGTELALEFVLPFELLNTPVERWTTEPASSAGSEPLALRYQVVVRSLERMRSRHWHRAWHQRWRRLLTGPQAEVFWNTRSTRSGHELAMTLAGDERVVAVVLSEPPSPDCPQGNREALAALRSGVPVIIWHRQDCSSREFKSTVSELTSGTIADLPARVCALRRSELTSGMGGAVDVFRELTVLWDDPGRQPGVWEESRPTVGGPA